MNWGDFVWGFAAGYILCAIFLLFWVGRNGD